MSNFGEILGSRGAPSTIVFAAFLTRLAKHLALLACLAILGQATGRTIVGQRAVLLLIVGAAFIHTVGATFTRRWRHDPSERGGST